MLPHRTGKRRKYIKYINFIISSPSKNVKEVMLCQKETPADLTAECSRRYISVTANTNIVLFLSSLQGFISIIGLPIFNNFLATYGVNTNLVLTFTPPLVYSLIF